MLRARFDRKGLKADAGFPLGVPDVVLHLQREPETRGQ
jgi:hypothetical protein